MEFDITLHGDQLERHFAEFITTHLPNYQGVWQMYVGNIGDNTMAAISEYQFDEARKSFSENSYTVLESLCQLNLMINADTFNVIPGNDFRRLLQLKNDILLFFSHLGRIRDNMSEAATKLRQAKMNIDPAKVESALCEFYFKRHLVVHGKALPFYINGEGHLEIPVLSISSVDPAGWYHKRDMWPDMGNFETKTAGETSTQLYFSLVACVNDLYGYFAKEIEKALGSKKINFVRFTGASGYSSADGSHGSGGKSGYSGSKNS